MVLCQLNTSLINFIFIGKVMIGMFVFVRLRVSEGIKTG